MFLLVPMLLRGNKFNIRYLNLGRCIVYYEGIY